MVVFTIVKARQDKKQQGIDIREAYNLWDLLKSKYTAIEFFKTLSNSARDRDLSFILNKVVNNLEKDSMTVENFMERFSLVSPDKNRQHVNYPKFSGAVKDEFLANELIVFLQEEAERLMRGYKTSISNDEVRSFFKKLVVARVNEMDILVQYLKLKGWIETPPLFNRTSVDVTEKVATVEIFHLWHHLTFRYDNITSTEIFIKYAFDGDFVITLKAGLQKLKKQVQMLEKELTHFGIPLPNPPGKITYTPRDTEILKDDHMFRTLLDGLQGAAIMHLHPLKECSVNDRIRKGCFLKSWML